MISSICFLLSLLIPLFFTLNSEANDQLLFRYYHECNQNLGNFTQGSIYQNNRGKVFEQIYSNKDINYGVYHVSYGKEPDKVYAIALCRGDAEPEDCRECLRTSAAILTDRCPIQKEAFSYSDWCTLRYSKNSLFGVIDSSEIGKVYYIQDKTGVIDYAFNQTLSDLLDELKSTASDGDQLKKFAEKSVKITNESSSNSNETIYGYAQCTPDLTKQDCTECLDTALGQFSIWCKQMKGCLYLGPICSVRYDITPFFESIVMNSTDSPAGPAPQPSQALPPALSPKSSTSAISINTSTSKESPAPQPSVELPPKRSSKIQTVIATAVPIVTVVLVLIFICIYLTHRKPKQNFEVNMGIYDDGGEEEMTIAESLLFNFDSIRVATNNFSDSNKLGQGGFGIVYRGQLPNKQMIAVKRLSTNSGQGDLEFKNEVLLVAKLQHRNLVRLLGCSLEKRERLLIYEFVPNKSLDYFIFDPTRKTLNWEKRYNIIKGIARGILYLHEDSRLRIIHRDLKASNILLDNEMNPKISDFGLAKLFVIGQTQGSTNRIVGTYGYMAPEYAMHGEFSVKSDVYSFGVLVLEIISGHKNGPNFCHGEDMEYLLTYAWRSWIEGRATDIIDPLLNKISQDEIMRCIHIGLLCIQENLIDRPTMSSVALMLSSYSLALSIPSKPAYFIGSGTRRLPDMQQQVDNVGATRSDESMNQISITDPYPR